MCVWSYSSKWGHQNLILGRNLVDNEGQITLTCQRPFHCQKGQLWAPHLCTAAAILTFIRQHIYSQRAKDPWIDMDLTSDIFASGRCLINVNLRRFAIWVASHGGMAKIRNPNSNLRSQVLMATFSGWQFALTMTVILWCSMPNWKEIRQLRWVLWVKKINTIRVNMNLW